MKVRNDCDREPLHEQGGVQHHIQEGRGRTGSPFGAVRVAPLSQNLDRPVEEPKLARMPTVLRSGPYRFFFYSSDRGEPPHIHVQRESMVAKFWLKPARLHESGGFSRVELRMIQGLVESSEKALLGAWNGFFAI